MLVATIVNLLVVAMASYRGAAYMDSPQFCGQSCHVMHPEYTAYKISAHSHVACVECHIGSGAEAYFSAKVNGTKQLIEVTLHPLRPGPKSFPTIPADSVAGDEPAPGALYLRGLPHARTVRGRKTAGQVRFADDEKNTETQTVLVLHLGGVDSLSHLSGIHGVHLGHIEYIATDTSRTDDSLGAEAQPRRLRDGVYSLCAEGAMPKGERRVMDCIDCHNRAAHTFVTAEEAINRAMADGVHQSRLALGPQGRPGAAARQLRQPGRGARQDPSAA